MKEENIKQMIEELKERDEAKSFDINKFEDKLFNLDLNSHPNRFYEKIKGIDQKIEEGDFGTERLEYKLSIDGILKNYKAEYSFLKSIGDKLRDPDKSPKKYKPKVVSKYILGDGLLVDMMERSIEKGYDFSLLCSLTSEDFRLAENSYIKSIFSDGAKSPFRTETSYTKPILIIPGFGKHSLITEWENRNEIYRKFDVNKMKRISKEEYIGSNILA